ncbi:MAG: type secretion outer membrane protein TolC family [Phycisphaerales bacterium]|nr:type secretion outer membrane protein TolC family [Phycisphaerales bacterium]
MAAVLPLLAGVSLVAGGCSTDAYRASADRDVYRLIEDRKRATLGYDPQAVSDPTVSPTTTQPSRALDERPPGDPTADARNERIENDPSTPAPKRAYAAIPVTPIPPVEPPAIELPAPVQPLLPLGPFPNEAAATAGLAAAGSAGQPVSLDPFAAEMASRWAENRLLYGPLAPRRKPLDLDLFAALRYGVRHSRTYRDRMDDLYLAALDVTLERHLLSPRPFLGGGLQYTGGQFDTAYQSALTATVNGGVRQRLPYGGEIVAQALVGFVHALGGNVEDGETASVALSGSLPLLRGAGLVNLEPLISSERELVYRVRAFEEFRRTFAIDVANRYFQLVASYQSVNNRRQQVVDSVSLLDRTRAIYAANLGGAGAIAGTRALKLTFLEVQRSEQQLLDAQNSLIDAQEAYLNALDDFKTFVGMEVRDDVEIVPVALELNIPPSQGDKLVDLAAAYRLDLQTARDRIDDARRQVAVAENGLLPDLNLTGGSTLGNRVGDAQTNLDSRNLTYSAGLTLDLPVDRLAERNVYRRALIAFHRAQRAHEELEDQVASDVRAADRAIRGSQAAIAIQLRSIELAERRLENANLLLKRGETNARDVVEAQQALIRAQDTYERARADLQVQVLQFLRQTGTLRIDPDTGTFGRALDRGRGPWPGGDGRKQIAPTERAEANTGPRPG